MGLFCKRTLLKRLYPTKEMCNFKEPTNHSHPIQHLYIHAPSVYVHSVCIVHICALCMYSAHMCTLYVYVCIHTEWIPAMCMLYMCTIHTECTYLYVYIQSGSLQCVWQKRFEETLSICIHVAVMRYVCVHIAHILRGLCMYTRCRDVPCVLKLTHTQLYIHTCSYIYIYQRDIYCSVVS